MSLVKKLPLVVLPLLAFGGALLGTLAAGGQLEKAPVVGKLLAGHGKGEKGHGAKPEHGEAAEKGRGEEAGHGGEGEPSSADGHGGEGKAGEGHGDGHGGEGKAGEGKSGEGIGAVGSGAAGGNVVAGVFELPRPYEAEELDGLVARLGTARTQAETRARAAQEEREALAQLGKDLDERRSEMERIMQDLDRDRTALDAERAAHEARLESLPDAEVEALRPVAKAYEEMSPEAAAERLGRLDPAGATKVLALMKPKKCAKVLEATEPARAAELSRRLAALRRGGGEPGKGGP